MDGEVTFDVGETGVILLGLDEEVIGAINEADFAVVVDHDDDKLRKFREGVVRLYREVPEIEQEILIRLADANPGEIKSGAVARFMRALAPLSNLDFEEGYFDE